jgi:signal transduction histidine kinase
VTPVDTQPLQVVQRALKMFDAEASTAGIQMEFIVSDSFKELGVDWVKMDPSRVLQVLINLTTNAIKFTTPETSRTIKVIISASRERPSTHVPSLVRFFPSRSKRVDQNLSAEWGLGEEIYLQFAVQDTGRGLDDAEKKLLFQRFSQASPRTHVQYGGSGLGLFISRELTELQGGEIGVESEAGKGSIFAFYIKCRRSTEPTDSTDHVPLMIGRQPSNAKDRPKFDGPKVRDFASASEENLDEQVKLKKSDLKVLIVEDNLG